MGKVGMGNGKCKKKWEMLEWEMWKGMGNVGKGPEATSKPPGAQRAGGIKLTYLTPSQAPNRQNTYQISDISVRYPKSSF